MESIGIYRYEYNPAGNLTAHTNGNSQTTTCRYDHNRLTEINYPDNPANNVYYTYGDSTATDNEKGRIVLQEGASGWQTFKYGALGEVVENVRTFALPFEEQSYTFKMEYKYDSYNRIQSITYPDGEVVSYGYDLGGMLRKVEGEKGNEHFVYVKDIDYNEFGLKENVLYGNGCQSHYSYDILQRLSRLRTLNSAGEIMQRLRYTYDKVSNITEIDNSAGVLANGLGGTYKNSYTYDNLYRLIRSTGTWNGTQPCSYRLSVGYTPNGRINNKNLTATTWLDGVSSTENHSNRYNYTTAQPNTLTHISSDAGMQDFEWDANGNMVFHHNDGIFDRHLCWDEENRLQGVADQNHTSYYQYDANGERTYKFTGAWQRQQVNGRWYDYCVLDNPTLYASPYLVATPKGYTKHYYAENERIASKIGGGGLFNVQCIMYNVQLSSDNEKWNEKIIKNKAQFHRVMGCLGRNVDVEDNIFKLLREHTDIIADETECYWYHPDHLGSSSWITYTDGAAVQHLHYLPWGESFIDQRVNSYDGTRYTFSAKEKDTETGYSYFGARYYSSDLSIWLSVDPMAGKYPSLSPYVYCANNPIKLVDPNGESIEVVSNNDGTYSISGGTLNSDKNIYKVKDGKRTGEILGQTLTNYSFFNEEGEAVLGTILNPKDNSGKEFLNDISRDRPNLFKYMINARNGEKYDFKSIGEEISTQTNSQYHLRGMPLSGVMGIKEDNIYGTARDVGNLAAGYVGAAAGLNWNQLRMGFDVYNNYKNPTTHGEGLDSQSAQRIGYNVGVKSRWTWKLYDKIFK